MENINWDMVRAIAFVVGATVSLIGGLILTATKLMFVTKKEFLDTISQGENKLSPKGIPIYVPQRDYNKNADAHNSEHKRIWAEIKDMVAIIVPRTEWDKSKAYRERRVDENQQKICTIMDKLSESFKDMQKEQNKTNEVLNKLAGSFETYCKKNK